MVIHVDDFLVQYVIVQQDQMLLRGALELRQAVLREVEHHLVIRDEQDLVPGNRQRGVPVRAGHHHLRHFGQLARLDDCKIAQPPDPLGLGEHRAAQNLAEVELVLEDGNHAASPESREG